MTRMATEPNMKPVVSSIRDTLWWLGTAAPNGWITMSTAPIGATGSAPVEVEFESLIDWRAAVALLDAGNVVNTDPKHLQATAVDLGGDGEEPVVIVLVWRQR